MRTCTVKERERDYSDVENKLSQRFSWLSELLNVHCPLL